MQEKSSLKRDRRFKFAVLGSGSWPPRSPECEKAFKIGNLVAANGHTLLTGACPGLPHAAAKGANAAGGLTIGVSPAMNRDDHTHRFHYPLDSDAIMFTGMGVRARNVILIRSADACVFIGGGMGTLNEFTIAYDELGPDCAIGILTGTGGMTAEFTRLGALVGRPPRPHMVEDPDPTRLIELLLVHLCKR